MAKRFAGEIHFAQAPDVVFAAQSDPHYVLWKHEHMAAFDVSAEAMEDGEHVMISSTRKLPAEIPSAARRFVGDSITVEEVHTWSHPEHDGTRHGTSPTHSGCPATPRTSWWHPYDACCSGRPLPCRHRPTARRHRPGYADHRPTAV